MPATFRSDDQNSNAFARYPVIVKPKITTFVNGNGTTAKAITESETTVLGSMVTQLIFTSDDIAANIFEFYLHDGTNLATLPFNYHAIEAQAGTNQSTSPVSILRSENFDPVVSLDNNGNPHIMLGPGWSIYAAPINAVGATYTVQCTAWSHDF